MAYSVVRLSEQNPHFTRLAALALCSKKGRFYEMRSENGTSHSFYGEHVTFGVFFADE
jgi:hypothetical protein